jgi:uncharacterized protein (UPF0333 family)
MKNPKHRTRRARRGAVQVEYAFLLLFVVVPAAGAIFLAGTQMYPNYKKARAVILSSNP